MTDYAEIIKNERKEHRLNRDSFAQLLGVSSSAVGMWESGANPPSLATMVLLSRDKTKDPWIRKLFQELLDATLAVKLGV